MLRTVLVGVCLAAAGAACGGGGAPEVSATAAAGTVRAITGGVTATAPGGAARALRVGDSVAASDTITTAADGRADIALAHNGATLHLDGGQSVRLDQSIAWGLPMQSGSATPAGAGDPLASAGRPAENESAHVVGAAPQGHGAADAKPAPPQQQPNPEPKPELKPELKPEPPPPPVAAPQPEPANEQKGKPADPKPVVPGPSGGGADNDVVLRQDVAKKPPSPTTPTAAAPDWTAVRACLPARSTSTLTLVVDGAGAITRATWTGGAVTAAELACLRIAATALHLGPGSHPVPL